MFRDRSEAGQMLAAAVWKRWRGGPHGIVLGLPRGGVIVAAPVSRALELPLDVFLSQKLRAPENPELALGAATETGSILLYNDQLRVYGLTRDDLAREIHVQQQEIRWRRQLYRGGRALPSVTGRPVVLVDDGAATGATVLAAIEALRTQRPARIVAALPVASMPAASAIGRAADELVCLRLPPTLVAVADHYRSFPSVPHSEVLATLSTRQGRPGPRRMSLTYAP